jgi:undecaprenyl-diphosphatase
MELAPTLSWSIAGAIVGDTLSYWVGRYFRADIWGLWPMRKYPGMIARGEGFFASHGGKGVLFGRFIGAVRPIMPTVAGVAGMRPLHFLTVDSISAILWAPCYILPGAVFGASLGLAAEVASRLAVLLLLAGLLLWLVFWSTRRVLAWLPAHAERLLHMLLDWSRRHRMLGRLGKGLADPAQPESPALAILALMLLSAGWVTLAIIWGFDDLRYPWPTDALVYQFLQDLRAPPADIAAMAIAQLGDWEVYLPLTIVILATLLLTQRRRAAAHWAAAVLFGAALAALLTLPFRIPEPARYYHEAGRAGFAAGHIVFGTVIYGFLPVLLSARLKPARRWWFYGPFLGLIALMAFARVYLGAQWLSDAVIGLTLGLLWVALLTLGYRRHRPQLVHTLPLLIASLIVFCIAGAMQWTTNLADDLQAYQARRYIAQMSPSEWRSDPYTRLPVYRVDLRGRMDRPLNLQWAGRLGEIRKRLSALGWQPPPGMSADSSLLWLTSRPGIEGLPVLPQLHDGEHQALLLRYPIDTSHQWVLRLWPSDWMVKENGRGIPIWVGNVSRQRLVGYIGAATVPITERDYDAPLEFFLEQLGGGGHIVMRQTRHPDKPENLAWDGRVVLIGP